ncbi:MAG: tRNA pseudouridine(55) synthase TruB [Chloroflexota bacterium]
MPATRRNIAGLLNINKPQGITSHDVVARVRKLSRQRKVGHAGTLDPMAGGVLLVCLGQATRLIEYLVTGRKQYRATVRFGATTDTLDADGQVVAQTDPAGLTESQLRGLLPAFLGDITQIPPIFSALKQGGQPLYKLARAGQSVEVEPRPVTIHALTWVAWVPPDLTLEVVCSPGTYIRALARDLGEAAGTGAHLAELTRTASGPWSLADAVPLIDLERAADWQQYLRPADEAVAHLPRVALAEDAARRVVQGQPTCLEGQLAAGDKFDLVRAYTPAGQFLAILTRVEADDKLWRPQKVFNLGEA